MHNPNKHAIRTFLCLAMTSLFLCQPAAYAYAGLSGSEAESPGSIDTTSILVHTDDASVIEKDDVISSYGDTYLLGYDSVSEAGKAYGHYDDIVTDGFVQPNTLFASADEINQDAPGLDGLDMADLEIESEAPALDSLKTELASAAPLHENGVVALIDTGVNEGANVLDNVSMLGGSPYDDNGHGQKMLEVMQEIYPDISVLSIKALDKNGYGDVSTVYAAIEYAISQNVRMINLSLCGKMTENNAALESAIDEAVLKGILVVGAAGNYGSDVKDFIPGNMEDVYVIGAAQADGHRLPPSNYGKTVDYNVVATSTSEAAAKFSAKTAGADCNIALIDQEKDKTGWLYSANDYSEGVISNADDGFSAQAPSLKKDGFDNDALYGYDMTVGKPGISDGGMYGGDIDFEYFDDEGYEVYYVHGESGRTIDVDGAVNLYFYDCVTGADGQKYSLHMKIDNVTIRVPSNESSGNYAFLEFKRGNSNIRFLAGYPFDKWGTSGFNSVGDISIGLDVEMSIIDENDHAVGGSVVFGFTDLDQPGYTNSSSTYDTFAEGIRFKAGLETNIYVEPNSHINTTMLGDDIYIHGSGSDDTHLRSAFSCKVNASKWKFRWVGTDCGSDCRFSLDSEFGDCKVRTYVLHQKKDGSWPATNSHTIVDRPTTIHKGMKYVYAWKSDEDDVYDNVIYKTPEYYNTVTDDTKKTNFSGSSYKITNNRVLEDTDYEIYLPRQKYKYSFDFNVPAGKTLNDVGNQQEDFTKLAENDSNSVISPTLDGFNFEGWNTERNGSGSAYKVEKMLSNKTFYAQWSRATYIVHFNANGSSNPNQESGERAQNATTGTMPDQEMQYDTAANLNANTFGRAGYRFIGWNTSPDGNGTSYGDGQSVTNLVGYDATEITLYAQWEKQLGTETITVVSEETGNPVAGISMQLYKNVSGTWTPVIVGTTNANGQITVNNLHWFDWKWVMTGVPAGYVKSADAMFTINYNQLSATNHVILYMKHVTITVDSQVSDIIKGERAPAFMYHISGTDVAGVTHEYDLLVQTNLASKLGSNRIPDLFAGTYTITQTPVSRYNPGTAVNISNAAPNGINASVDVKNYDSAEVKFPYTIKEYGWYYGVDGKINKLTK